MAKFIQQFLRDESGLVITAELIMIITIAVISLSAGWGAVASMLAEELEDVANSVGSLDQSFSYNGLSAPGHATCSGGGFNDSNNTVNVSTSTNCNASVAGLDFTPLIPVIPAPALNAAAVGGDPLVLVEDEFAVNSQMDAAFVADLEQLGVVTVRADGSVVLLREDLVERQADGSVRIIDETLLQQRVLLQEQRARAAAAGVTGQDATGENRDEVETSGKKAAAQSSADSEQLRLENTRLRQLIEKLCKETLSR
jgi:hypothetical protein